MAVVGNKRSLLAVVLTLVLPHLLISGVLSATFNLHNNCSYTVWPGIFSTGLTAPLSTTGRTAPLSTTGFALQSGKSRVVDAPTNWVGRLWARTHCSTDSAGNFSCLTGNCNSSKLECLGNNYTPPATIAEFSLSGAGGRDFFDVSLVDGYNLPMLVTPLRDSCTSTGCVVDLNRVCPSELTVIDSEGKQGIACRNPCDAFGVAQYCCSGAYRTPDVCKPSLYSQLFKNSCPLAYSFAFDDQNSTFTCAAANYLITFCPAALNNTRDSRTRAHSPTATPAMTRAAPSPVPARTTSSPSGPLRTPGSRKNKVMKLAIGITGAIIGVLSAIILLICFRGRVLATNGATMFWRRKSKDERIVESFIKSYPSLALKRYSYPDIKRMTNSFQDKLGEGGYGSVFKGKLPNGKPVAVKFLIASKGNGVDFMNEVSSISRTSHVNIVGLVGFCSDGPKRGLIYEFMPNGSLDKFIFNGMSSEPRQCLGWERMYKIAIGIARGLEYLHRGCSTRILHFDIKPHNILLDEDFCPKISDFGLSKLCSRNESIVSTMEARGTIGYIAPEVCNRNFGGVSYKSDVYSYGMMVLEMAGGRKNLHLQANHSSRIYFPHWVYKRLEQGADLELQCDEARGENEIAKKMVYVGLWCIQIDPSHRPSMSEVIEMLEGKTEALKFPPRPFTCSPTSSPENKL